MATRRIGADADHGAVQRAELLVQVAKFLALERASRACRPWDRNRPRPVLPVVIGQPPRVVRTGRGARSPRAAERSPARSSAQPAAALASTCSTARLRVNLIAALSILIEQSEPHMLQTLEPDGFAFFLVTARLVGIHRHRVHAFPVERLAIARHLVVPDLRGAHALDQIARMRRDPRGDNALAHVVDIGQAQMLGGSHVAEEIGAGGRGDRAADRAGDVVVARARRRRSAVPGRKTARRRRRAFRASRWLRFDRAAHGPALRSSPARRGCARARSAHPAPAIPRVARDRWRRRWRRDAGRRRARS